MCYAPENTLAAFEIAIAQETYRTEFDVRRCRTGELVVIHDATVDRTTNGTGRVADFSLAELKALRTFGKDGVETKETIPTFDETLTCLRGRVKLLVEIKEVGLADAVVEQIAAHGMESDCTVSSFQENELLRIKTIAPQIATAYFFTKPQPLDPQEIIARLGVGLLVAWPAAATPETLADAKACGLQIRCGFRDDLTYDEIHALFQRMVEMGADEIACGRPDWIGHMASELAND